MSKDQWGKIINRIVAMFERSTVTQAAITVLVIGGYVALVLMGRPIPEQMSLFAASLLFFFFGGKVGQSAGEVRAIEKIERARKGEAEPD